MKVTIYTVADCQFSKAEKEYLQAHNQPFEEKSLETNKEFLTEMLTLSNNFSGTPVTKVEKDGGEISILKGFTKEEFDKAMGYSQPKEAVINSTIDVPTKPTTPPTPPSPTQPTLTPTTPVEEKKDEVLNAVLNDLQSKSETTPPAPTTTPTTSPTTSPPTGAASNTTGELPKIPEPDFK